MLASGASANIISDEYFPEVYIWMDDQPVDSNYILRINHQYFTEAGKERFDDWTDPCDQGKCRITEHIKNPERYWYYLKKNDAVDEFDITDDVRGMDLSPKTLRKVDFEIRINSEDGSVVVKEVDKGEYDPMAELEGNNFSRVTTGVIVAIIVAAVVLLIGIILVIYLALVKKKK